jgi:hypothetical protein
MLPYHLTLLSCRGLGIPIREESRVATLASGGNIYDPAIDGSGVFTIVSSPIVGDTASVTIDIIAATATNISGVPYTLCESDNQ